MPLLAFDLDILTEAQDVYRDTEPDESEPFLAPSIEDSLADALSRTRHYELFGAAGKHVIRCIHALPDLYTDVERGQLTIYIGRSAARPANVYSRFASHSESKDHGAGVVLLRCYRDVIRIWERAAILVIKELELREHLCVANIASDSRGQMPKHDECCLYMTWGRTRKKKLTVARRQEIESIATIAAGDMGDGPNFDQFCRALDPLTRPQQEKADLDWAPGHDLD